MKNISVFSPSGTKTAPSGSTISGGYIPGDYLPAHNQNYYFNAFSLLIQECNNLIVAAGETADPNVTDQILTAINTLISSGGSGTHTANTVLAGPATGSPAAASFRALVADDIPNLDTSKLTTGTLGVTRGGTGLATFSQGDILYSSALNTLSALAKSTTATRYLANTGSSNNPQWDQVNLANGVTGNLPVTNLDSGTSASNLTFWRGDGTWATPGGGGTVTSVGLSLPSIFSVSGSPVTGSGTLTGSLTTQSANTVLAGPSSGGAATPTFRALVTADFMTHEYVSNSSSTDADDTTSFVTGTTGSGSGAAGGGSVGVIRTTALTATRAKGVQFAAAVKAGDLIYIEFYNGTNWTSYNMTKIATVGGLPIVVDSMIINGGTTYGMGLDVISSTRINVLFGNYMKFQNGGASLDWNNAGIVSGTQWRVHKISFN